MARRPFRIDVPDAVLIDLRERLGRTRWPEQLPDAGWDYGANLRLELQSITHNLIYHADWLANFYVLDLLRESADLAREKKVKHWRKAKAINTRNTS